MKLIYEITINIFVQFLRRELIKQQYCNNFIYLLEKNEITTQDLNTLKGLIQVFIGRLDPRCIPYK
jgi:hypothetical protein